MEGPSKYQRIKLALLRQQGGTLVIEKQNRDKGELWRLIQQLVDNREGVEIIRETPSIVMYRFHPRNR